MKHKIIFIDWHHTLSMARFWQNWEVTRPQYTKLIQDHFFQNDIETTLSWMRGQLSAEDVVQILSERTLIPAEELLTELRKSAECLPLLDESVLKRISMLRTLGIKTAIATDNMDTFTRWTVPGMGLDEYFDDVLNSHTLKALKSDIDEVGRSKFFYEYLADQGVKPKEAIIFDDNVDYVKRIGIDYVQITKDKPLKLELEKYISSNWK